MIAIFSLTQQLTLTVESLTDSGCFVRRSKTSIGYGVLSRKLWWKVA